MKALIFSDSHGMSSHICWAIEDNPDTDLIIFAGDVQRDIEEVMYIYPRIPCAYVLGNNDYFIHDVPYERFFEFGGKKIFLTHGHKYGVKLSPATVVSEAKKRGADICVFGHTHNRYLDIGDICVVNPGSARTSYAVLTINNGVINIEHRVIA